jgi:hypothetical protein
MDPISFEYTNAPFPSRRPDRVCFVIAVEKAAQQTLPFVHDPRHITRPGNLPACTAQELTRASQLDTTLRPQ